MFEFKAVMYRDGLIVREAGPFMSIREGLDKLACLPDWNGVDDYSTEWQVAGGEFDGLEIYPNMEDYL